MLGARKPRHPVIEALDWRLVATLLGFAHAIDTSLQPGVRLTWTDNRALHRQSGAATNSISVLQEVRGQGRPGGKGQRDPRQAAVF